MLPGTYDRPLYSFLLVPDSAELKDDPRYVLRVPQGLLTIPRSLRRAAEGLTSVACLRMLEEGLSHHRLAVPGFSRAGLTPDWADNLRFWGQRMDAEEHNRTGAGTGLSLLARDGQGALRHGRELWTRLGLSAQLAGLGRTLTPGRPRSARDLLFSLQQAAGRVRDPETGACLSRSGFGAEEQADLSRTIALLQDFVERRPAAAQARQKSSGALVVIRGAILGDLRRLSKAARLVLRPEHAAALHMRRLLQRPRPAARPSGAGAG